MSPVIIRLLLHGLETTAVSTVLSVGVAFPVAFATGLARLAPWRAVRILATTYVELARGTSALVQLFWAFFVLPAVGLTLPPLLVGVAVLGLNAGAYASEVVRGAVQSVPRGQWEAATSLGLSRSSRMWFVILPQAIPTMLPSFGNIAIDILKGTSLFSLITITDLTRVVNQLSVIGQMSFGFGYSILLVLYFLLSLPLMALIKAVEVRTGRHLVGRI